MNDSLDAQKGTTAQNSVTKPTRRRRHDYSPELADLICDRIAGGASLRQICQDATMPARSTIFVWLEEHEDFARSYALARQIQIEDLVDEILEIADDSSNDWIDREGADGKKYRFLGPVGDCRHKDYGRLTMSPLVLSTMANNSLCSASGTLNFAIVSSRSLQKAAHSLSVILRCL